MPLNGILSWRCVVHLFCAPEPPPVANVSAANRASPSNTVLHPTPLPHPDTETAADGVMLWATQRNEADKFCLKKVSKKASAILRITGICLLLKTPNLATVRVVSERRVESRQPVGLARAQTAGESDLNWFLEPSTVCHLSEALSAREMGKWPEPSQGEGLDSQALAHCPTRCHDWSLRKSTGWGGRRPSPWRWPPYAPWVSATPSSSLGLSLFICSMKVWAVIRTSPTMAAEGSQALGWVKNIYTSNNF